MEKIIIPINEEIYKFDNFLNNKNNHRILFSGCFGSGKTYFLQKYFEQKSEQYEMFYISPVNYCISQNDDILKLMQYDLLVDIMFKKLMPETKEQFSHWETINYFVYSNLLNIVKDAVSHCGKTGKKGSDVYDSFTKWFEKYNQFYNAVNKTQAKKIADLTEGLAESLEFNQNTELISEIISNISKKKVLIIDDLDRVDPEHIFRLLNVFSAQLSGYFSSHYYGEDENNNKFGFDKIIFVCDIDNIRKIFYAKYGQKTDFSGYIDKFYSTTPYLWDNKDQLLKAVYKYVDSVHSELDKEEQRNLLYPVMRILVHYNAINLRKFVEKEDQEWIWPYRKYPIVKSQINIYSAEIVDFTLFIFGTIGDAVDVLEKHTESFEMKSNNRILDHLLPLIDTDYYKYQNGGYSNIKYSNIDLDIIIVYDIAKNNNYPTISKIMNSREKEKKQIPFFQLLKIAIENYHSLVKDGEIIQY